MLIHALKPQQSRLKNKTGMMSESRLMPLARTAVSSWSALKRPNTSSIAVSNPIGSAKTQTNGTSRPMASSHGAERGVAADQQREDFLEHVADEQHEGEHRHRHEQRGQHLAGQIIM